MEIKKSTIIIWISGSIFFLFNIFNIIFTIWTNKAIQILYYLCFCFIFFCYLYILLLEISINSYHLRNFKYKGIKYILVLGMFFFVLIFCECLLLFINILKFLNFWKNCPYLISDLDYNLHLDRRCELYNINYNSRYTYQYICSYNSEKEFAETNKKKLIQEISPNKVKCIPVKELIPNNEKIVLFNNCYEKKKKYYCSRTNLPEDYKFAKHKDCTKVKYGLMITFWFLSFTQIIFIRVYLIHIKHVNFDNRRFNIILRNRNIRNDNERINREAMEIHHLINFTRLLNLIRDLINININANTISNCSTERSEKPGENVDYEIEKTKNIIIENNQEFSIDTNIKNLSSIDKKNKINNSINPDKMSSISFDINSEETKIQNQNDINNINNISNQ